MLTRKGWVLVVFFNDTATTEIYTLSLHDALPISISSTRASRKASRTCRSCAKPRRPRPRRPARAACRVRSEEHTSELQSRQYLVCRLLLEKKKSNRLGNSIRAISFWYYSQNVSAS